MLEGQRKIAALPADSAFVRTPYEWLAVLVDWQHRQQARESPDRRLWHSQQLLRAGTSRTRRRTAQQGGATGCWCPASVLSFQIDGTTVADAIGAVQRMQDALQPHELIIDAFAPAPASVCAICCTSHVRARWSFEKPFEMLHGHASWPCRKFSRSVRRGRVRP